MRTTTRRAGLRTAVTGAVAALAAGTITVNPSDAAHAATTSSLSVLTANIAQAGRVPALRDRIQKKHPDVVVLSEAWNARKFLGSIGGYRKFQAGTGHANAGGVVILVRTGTGIAVKDNEYLRMRLGFTGPHGAKQPPRVYPAVTLRKQSKTWRVLGVHFPWVRANQRLGSPTWKESANATVAYLKRGSSSANVAAGDFNSTPEQMRTMGRRVPAHFVRGAKVDHSLAKRTATRSANVLSAPSGMHGWVFYRFTANVAAG